MMSRQKWAVGETEQNHEGERITGIREEGKEISVGRRGTEGEWNRRRRFVVDYKKYKDNFARFFY
jgi:hypothetical protein